MLVKYEKLRCQQCKKEFEGRKPAEDGEILCPICLNTKLVPIINETGLPDHNEGGN